MQDIIAEDFQLLIGELLTRNRSLMDITSKYQETAAKVNRAICKAVTHCGCIRLNASKQKFNENVPIEQLAPLMESHLEGELCPKCRKIIEQELGENLFYIGALCNTLDLSMQDVLINERTRLSTLGRFHMR